jgi:FkbM family methyltransferase
MAAVWRDQLHHGERIRPLARYIAWHTYHVRTGQPYLADLPNGYRTLVWPDSDSGVSNVYSRRVDYHEMRYAREVLARDDYAIDVGANVGNRTLAIADRIRGALLIDANPIALDRARINLEINGLDLERFEFLEAAVGAVSGWAEFSTLPGTSTLNRVLEDDAVGERRTVRMTTLDDVMAKDPSRVCNFLKTDAEGADYDVLLGASRILSSAELKLVMFERWPSVPIEQFTSLLAKFDLHVFALDTSGEPTTRPKVLTDSPNLLARRAR